MSNQHNSSISNRADNPIHDVDENYAIFDPLADENDKNLPEKVSEEIDKPARPEIFETRVFLYIKPPYFEFKDTKDVMEKFDEIYNQKGLLLLVGYSGCGKTTHCELYADQHDYVQYYYDFASFTPSGLNMDLGEKYKQPLKQRRSEIFSLTDALSNAPNQMFIFDDVDVISPDSTLQKMENMRKLWQKTHIPMVFAGTTQLYRDLYKHSTGHFASILTNLDEHEMNGMLKKDAENYIDSLIDSEHVQFTHEAKKAIVPMALNTRLGGIRSFTKIIGRAITKMRALYYTSEGRTIPPSALCYQPEIESDGKRPRTSETYILPKTPDLLTIREDLIRLLLADYKIICKKGRIPSTNDLNE